MKITTKEIVMIGMFAAILGVLSILTIPMPSGVPITLQTFAVALCGYVLGTRKGPAAVAVYLLLGTVGVPVFAGMSAGPGVLFGYSGGFLWGFLFLAGFCGSLNGQKNRAVRVVIGLAGLLLCHLCGILQFMFLTSGNFFHSFLIVSLPYLLKDIVSVAGAYLVSVPIRKALTAGAILPEETTRVRSGRKKETGA